MSEEKTPLIPRPPSRQRRPDLTGVSEEVRDYIRSLEKRSEHRYVLPRAPQAKTMVDFVVQIFVVVVATILILSIVGAGLLVAFGDDNTNVGPLINSITDITNTIIGALIGFVAGKGQGKQEAHEEQVEQHKQDMKQWQDGP